jgi:hypothetical protein
MFDPIYEYQPCETSSSLLLFTSTYVEIIKNESDDTDKDHITTPGRLTAFTFSLEDVSLDVGTVGFFLRWLLLKIQNSLLDVATVALVVLTS